jgi:hypothetical protein
MQMARFLSIAADLLCLVLVSATAAAQAGVGYPGPPVGSDVIVASVTKVSGHAATNAHPPEVELKVEQVLHGDPKLDRRRAVWDPIDFNWDVPADGEFEQWKTTPLEGPRVGERWILWGVFHGDEGPARFHISAKGRFPFDTQALGETTALIRQYEAARRAFVAKVEAEAKPLREQRDKWRAQVTDADIRHYYEQSDFVVLARIVSHSRQYADMECRICKVFKGQTRRLIEIIPRGPWGADDPLSIHVQFPKNTNKTLSELFHVLPKECFLFLSERGLRLEVWPRYHPIDSGDGIVIADAAARQAVAEAAKRKPPQAPRPVLLLWSNLTHDPSLKFFEQAAVDKFVVVPVSKYREGALSLGAQDREKRVPPGGNAVVIHYRTYRENQRIQYVAAVRSGKNMRQTVLEEHFESPGIATSPGVDFGRLAPEIVRRLLDPKFSLPVK